MHYLFTATFAALVGLAMAQPAQAASPGGKDFYGAARVGAVVSTNEGAFGNQPNFQIESSPDAGYHIEGAVGGWIGSVYRTDLSIGWRSYETDGSLRPIGPEMDNAATPTDERTSPAEALIAYINAAGLAATASGADALTEVSVLNFVWNNYFHVLEGEHQPYFGFGVGVGLWTFDGAGFSDAFKVAFFGRLTAGYDYYLSGLPQNYKNTVGGDLLDNVVVGLAYDFSWSNPKPSGAGGNRGVTGNDDFQQISHAILFTARYEF